MKKKILTESLNEFTSKPAEACSFDGYMILCVCVCIYMYLLLPRCLCLSFERIERNGICYLWVEIVEELLRNCKNTLKRGEESYYKYFLEIRNSILFYFNFFSLSFCMLLKIASCGWCLFFFIRLMPEIKNLSEASFCFDYPHLILFL